MEFRRLARPEYPCTQMLETGEIETQLRSGNNKIRVKDEQREFSGVECTVPGVGWGGIYTEREREMLAKNQSETLAKNQSDSMLCLLSE